MCELCVNCLFCSQYASAEENHCVWYGQCNIDDLGRYQNCPYEGPAKELEAGGQTLLKKWCPHFFDSKGKLRFIPLTELNMIASTGETETLHYYRSIC
jgi:hypothetical protein